MKIRSGFVSNSSSSSFVFVGWEFDRDSKTQKEWLEAVLSEKRRTELAQSCDKQNWSELNEDEICDIYYDIRDEEVAILDHEEQGAPVGKTLVGKLLTIGDDCGFLEGNWSLPELMEEINDFPFDKNEIKIIAGSMLT